ncbi:hypothetical protein HF263_02850 [Rhizobium leguminosarum]|jgi:hypothetical protein|uniref:hypothetical protein n=1 Tax=Rhizobium leguminosarum TaxID=384 RepID=UPI001C929D3E|nr:hypothetical protein [Rhizobium leguminosarum]MBY3055017.1 hypothetical protein [Rhizobium leguminosarum]
MSEADFMRGIQRLASQWGARLLRQNTGLAWVGKVERITMARKVSVKPGDVVIRAARPFHAGFPGWSDLGGWVSKTITPEMVGTTIAQYTVVETKIDTRATAEQMDFLNCVKAAGGRAGIVKTEDDLKKILFD